MIWEIVCSMECHLCPAPEAMLYTHLVDANSRRPLAFRLLFLKQTRLSMPRLDFDPRQVLAAAVNLVLQ